jgi:hypothetical protein
MQQILNLFESMILLGWHLESRLTKHEDINNRTNRIKTCYYLSLNHIKNEAYKRYGCTSLICSPCSSYSMNIPSRILRHVKINYLIRLKKKVKPASWSKLVNIVNGFNCGLKDVESWLNFIWPVIKEKGRYTLKSVTLLSKKQNIVELELGAPKLLTVILFWPHWTIIYPHICSWWI